MRNANRESTRGVRLLHRPDRPNAFGVQWSERAWDAKAKREVRKVKTQFFPTEKARDDRARKLREDKRAGLLRGLNRQEADEYFAIKAAIGNTPWQVVVAAWQRSGNVVASTVTIRERVTDYLQRLDLRVKGAEIALNTYRQRKHKLGLFAEHFGHLPLSGVRPDDIKKWLASFAHENAGTFNNYRKMVAVFFADCVHDQLLAENPCDAVRNREIVREEVGILTIPQIARLFHTAQTETDYTVCLRRLALETFAGVRFSSACRLTAADVNVADKGIRHPARSIKTRKRLYVEGFPENLWAWIQVAPDDSKLTERQYLDLKSRLFMVARVPHPHNCLRHSFATYHVAARDNPGLTAVLLGHRNQQKLWDHYKGNATKADGLRFETITPQSCAALAQEGLPVSGAPAPSADQRGTSPARADG